jgi:signal transduction histidine kinase
MRVSTKITAALSAAALLVFGANGFMRLREERRDSLAEAESEARTLGTAVRVAVENALRDRQLGDVEETLEMLEDIDPEVDFFIVDPAGSLVASSAGADPLDSAQTGLLSEVRDHHHTVVRFEETRFPPELVLAMPLLDAREPGGFLLIIKPLTEGEQEIAAARDDIIRSVAFFVVAISLLGFVLGMIYVKRPLDRLAAAMQRLRKGDLHTELRVAARDEVSALAQEFNHLVVDLRDAHMRLAAEQESRRHLEHGLQHVDKLVTVGQLAAGLAHEIGSPLQILNGRAHALMNKRHDPAQVYKNARIMIDESDRIARIVDQLLALSRRRAPRLVKVDARSAAEQVVGLLNVVVQRRQVELTLDSSDDLPSVVADRDQFQQALLNLINNALDASPPGARVAVSLSESSLRAVGGVLNVPALRVVVRDQGCGMSRETLDRCFEPFFTTRTDVGGTGLGLAVVKTIVADHGGVIHAESEPDSGSCFTVDLPLPGPVWRNRLVA